MKEKFFFAIFFLLLCCILACKKNCKQFNEEQLLPWISFSHPESLIYANQFGDTIRFLDGIWNESYDYTVSYDISSPCISYIRCLAQNDNPYSSISVSLEKVRANLQVSFFVAYEIDTIYTSGYIISYKSNDEIVSNPVTIDGVSYKESHTIEMDTNEYLGAETYFYHRDVWKCILVKDHGVMQFYEKSGTIWTLVE